MRRRSTGPAVALFPFLAVLLCAMGALILLLLILTRQIREDALQADSVPPPVATPELPASVPVVTVMLPPTPVPAPVDPNVELQQRLEALVAEKDAANRDLARLRQTVAERSQAVRSAEALVASAAFEAEATQQRLSARQAGVREREVAKSELLDAVQRARGTLESTRQTAASAEPKVSIVPYDGRYGTPRRPILIECTGSMIRFLSEGVELTAADVESFQPDHNPLLAGVVALRRHWARVDEPGSPNAYVLLLVREDGVAAYYAARALLQSLEGETGYELVTDDLAIDVPEADPAARDACRSAVTDVLSGRRPARTELASREPLFPSGRFEVDPGDHDPTNRGSSPVDDRLPPGRLSATRPTGRSLADSETPIPRGASPLRNELPPGGLAGGLPSSGNVPPTASLPPRTSTAASSRFLPERSGGDDDRVSTHTMGHDALPEAYGIESKKRWGVNAPTANIALERPVSMNVSSSGIVVGSQPPIAIDELGVSLSTVRDVFAAIDREAHAWGRAPGQFYWSPRLFATVQPGGTGHYDRLRRSLTRGGLRVSSEIVLAPATPAFLELNHAETAP